MSCQTPRDPRLRYVPWRDLASLSRWESVRELLLSLPWLVFSLWLASREMYAAALLASFLFFLTGLRQVHDAWHRNLGVSRTACDLIMTVMSVLMLGSMHAVRVVHMLHHHHCLKKADTEGQSALVSAPMAILTGPLFFLLKHAKAWQSGGNRDRRWIAVELLLNAAWISLVFGILDVAALRYHVAAMVAGQCLFPFFSVWLVHHGCDGSRLVARTLRGRLKNIASYGMFYHVEHHLFPGVPTCRLGRLADRLDRAAPDLRKHSVF